MALELHYNVLGCYRPPAEDLELAKRAIDGGFEGIWIADHFMPWIDSRPYTHHPFTWLGALMSQIPDVPVGTAVTCPMMRYRPPLLAQAIATLDNMYPGRFHLGVGVGEALNEAHFIDREWPRWGERAEMLIEAIEIMNRLWDSSEYLTYNGDHFSYDGIKLYTPPKEEIEIHWAAWGPQSCSYAGQFADHLMTVAPAKTIETEIIPNFKHGLAKANRAFQDTEVTSEFFTSIGDPAELVAEVRNRGDYVPADTELDNPDPRSIQSVADSRLRELSDEEICEEFNLTNDPADVIEVLESYDSAGVDRVLVDSICGDPYRTITAFENHIIPHFA